MCFASNSPFDEKPVNSKLIHNFAYPTADATQLTSVATSLAKALFMPGVNYYKVGVGLLDLSDGEHEQFDMLNPTPNNTELMSVFDGINHIKNKSCQYST